MIHIIWSIADGPYVIGFVISLFLIVRKLNLLQRISLALVAVSFAGVPVEVVNAFEYLQGARLTLIASDPVVTATLCILSVTRVILIILNLQFWDRQWKEIVANFMNSITIDLNQDVFDLFRLFMFLAAIVIHDCIYQFVRLFYHSR